MAHWGRPVLFAYAASAVVSVLLLGTLVHATATASGWRRVPWTLLLLCYGGLACGAQSYLFARYHSYINRRSVLVGTSMLPSVGQQLVADIGAFSAAILPPVVGAVVLAAIVSRVLDARSSTTRHLDLTLAAVVSIAACGVSNGGGEQAATPDVLYLSAFIELAHARWIHHDDVGRIYPGSRSPIAIPHLKTEPNRNILFIVTESVRAADSCVEPSKPCETTPFSNRAAKNRFILQQMRAVDSSTAISIAVMWTGLAVDASREDFHRMPLVWEYAHNAGYKTAYFTSQNLFFGNQAIWLSGLPLDETFSATNIDPNPTYETGANDGALVTQSLERLARLGAPYVAIVHLSNTHFPYEIDPSDAPFQPQRVAFGSGDRLHVHNRYKDAIYAQDKHIARLVEGARTLPGGERTVIVFTSDHGEQMREWGAVGHANTLLDAEIHIPFWIDAQGTTLTPEERSTLATLRDVPLTTLDVMPTLLDLMGLDGHPDLAPIRTKMPGKSLLRGGSPPTTPVIISNCSPIFACAFKNWGAIQGQRKVFATQNAHKWSCFDLAVDPHEEAPLPPKECADLIRLAEADGRGSPF